LRFALETGALELRDANDPARLVVPSGTIPFATQLLRVVTRPAAVALGVTQDPPANAPRGARDVVVLGVQVKHPGTDGQATIAASQLSIFVRDVNGRPLAASAVSSGARLVIGQTALEATVAADSLRFDLTSLPSLEPGTAHDVSLALDVAPMPAVEDVRFAIDAAALRAQSDGVAIGVAPTSGATLPYLSPSLHLAAASLTESFSNYPNPFAAGREETHITFNLSGDASVTLEVYDLSGTRVVRLLDRAPLTAGLHDTLRWDGRNGEGEIVRNGTYLLRLLAEGPGGGKVLRKMAVLR
jgi:hypothetical protein